MVKRSVFTADPQKLERDFYMGTNRSKSHTEFHLVSKSLSRLRSTHMRSIIPGINAGKLQSLTVLTARCKSLNPRFFTLNPRFSTPPKIEFLSTAFPTRFENDGHMVMIHLCSHPLLVLLLYSRAYTLVACDECSVSKATERGRAISCTTADGEPTTRVARIFCPVTLLLDLRLSL